MTAPSVTAPCVGTVARRPGLPNSFRGVSCDLPRNTARSALRPKLLAVLSGPPPPTVLRHECPTDTSVGLEGDLAAGQAASGSGAAERCVAAAASPHPYTGSRSPDRWAPPPPRASPTVCSACLSCPVPIVSGCGSLSYGCPGDLHAGRLPIRWLH